MDLPGYSPQSASLLRVLTRRTERVLESKEFVTGHELFENSHELSKLRVTSKEVTLRFRRVAKHWKDGATAQRASKKPGTSAVAPARCIQREAKGFDSFQGIQAGGAGLARCSRVATHFVSVST